MLNLTQQQKIKMFLLDTIMADAVKEVIRETFMKAKDGDVYMKASQMMAINLLEESFNELNKYANQAEQKIKEIKQVGL